LFLVFPFLAWIAIVTSIVLLGVLWTGGDLGEGHAATLLGWLLIAGYCQFFGSSVVVGTAGLVLQTVLAIYLLFRWKLSG
jgi:hypothetical protein